MKKFFVFLVFFISSLVFIIRPEAYVRVESDVHFFNPFETDIIIDNNFNWGTGTQIDYSSPWIYSAGEYFSAGGVSGDNLIVDADYYFGVRGLPYTDSSFGNYLNSTRNTLVSSNLKCGIGDYGTGYDSTYLPEVTNFNVSYETDSNSTGNYILYHITFTYNQRIKSVTKSNSNIWCFFQRNPDTGLFIQPVSPLGASSFYYYGYTNSLKYAVTSDPNTILLTEITNQNNITNNKIDSINSNITSEDNDYDSSKCGIICKLKKLPSKLLDGIKSIFIPDDFDFINDFVDTIEDKLGFIASIPIQLIEFILNLANASWEDVTSISFPSVSIFGYNFWNSQEVDISTGINIFKPYRYITDILCVIICCRTLHKWYEKFTGGGSE